MPENNGDKRTLRASDRDREAVAEVLRQAAGDGRLSIDELEERLEAAYRAKTYAELDPLVSDLPVTSMPSDHAPTLTSPGSSIAAGAEKPLSLRATLDNQTRSGAWRVPASIVAEPLFANVKLNFLEASCDHAVVDLEIRPGAGNVVLVLPPGWAVDTDELRQSWGSIRNKAPRQPGGGKPLIRAHGSVGVSTFVARGPYFYEHSDR